MRGIGDRIGEESRFNIAAELIIAQESYMSLS